MGPKLTGQNAGLKPKSRFVCNKDRSLVKGGMLHVHLFVYVAATIEVAVLERASWSGDSR